MLRDLRVVAREVLLYYEQQRHPTRAFLDAQVSHSVRGPLACQAVVGLLQLYLKHVVPEAQHKDANIRELLDRLEHTMYVFFKRIWNCPRITPCMRANPYVRRVRDAFVRDPEGSLVEAMNDMDRLADMLEIYVIDKLRS